LNCIVSSHRHSVGSFLVYLKDAATTEIYTLSLHDALPISGAGRGAGRARAVVDGRGRAGPGARATGAAAPVGAGARGSRPGPRRSEEHTSELQSRENLVCRLLLEKKKKKRTKVNK